MEVDGGRQRQMHQNFDVYRGLSNQEIPVPTHRRHKRLSANSVGSVAANDWQADAFVAMVTNTSASTTAAGSKLTECVRRMSEANWRVTSVTSGLKLINLPPQQ